MPVLWSGAEPTNSGSSEQNAWPERLPKRIATAGSTPCGAPLHQFSKGGMPTACTSNSHSSGPARGGNRAALSDSHDWFVDWSSYRNFRWWAMQDGAFRRGFRDKGGAMGAHSFSRAAAFLGKAVGSDDNWLAFILDFALLGMLIFEFLLLALCIAAFD